MWEALAVLRLSVRSTEKIPENGFNIPKVKEGTPNMEFYINHTRQQIARKPSDEWDEDDDIDMEVIHMDDEDEFFMMVYLIDKNNYQINANDRELFMKDIDSERMIIEQYDNMLKEEENDSSQQWGGWDEAGASFDY